MTGHARAVTERRLRAMGSACHLVVVAEDADRLVDDLVGALEHLEAHWSRFEPDSDLRRAAGADGRAVRVDRSTIRLVEQMRHLHLVTEGWFDPTIDVTRLGYDRDLRALAGPSHAAPTNLTCGAAPGMHGVVTDDTRNLLRVPPGLLLDAGSIGKGAAADALADAAFERGATGALVNLGGDVRARGHDEDGAAWGVVVGDPRRTAPADEESVAAPDDLDELLVGLDDGALVTSTVLRRCWTAPDGGTAHHVIGPADGRPVTHDLVAVSVLADTGWWADGLATALLAAGQAAPALAARVGASCRLVGRDGAPQLVGEWPTIWVPTA